MTNSSPDSYLELPSDQSLSDRGKLLTASWWERKSIRFKTTVLAIAIGTIPTITVGLTAYYFASRSIKQETTSLRSSIVLDLQNQVNVFMRDRLGEVKVMATLDVFTDPQLRKVATAKQKSAALQKIKDSNTIYNSIAVFDTKGELIAQTQGRTLGNHLNRSYVQDALQADEAIVSQPAISTSSGIYSIYTVSPVKDQISGKTIGFVRARMPVSVLKNMLKEYGTDGSQYYLLTNKDEIFLGSAGEYIIKTRSDSSSVSKSFDFEAIKPDKIFSGVENLLNNKITTAQRATNLNNQQEQFLTYAPAKQVPGLTNLNWQAIIATDSNIVFAPQRHLRQIFVLGVGFVALGVGAIAYMLANRLLRPILSAAEAVKEIGQGNLDTRLAILGADEISQLSVNINGMAGQLSNLVKRQALLAEHSETIKEATIQFAAARNREEILNLAVEKTNKTITSSRVVYYQFTENRAGKVAAESFVSGLTPIENGDILSADLIEAYQREHQENRTQVKIINDLDLDYVSQSYRKQLKQLNINASLIAPVINDHRLDGLLMVHDSVKRVWTRGEVEFITQLANQVSSGLTRLTFFAALKQGENREKAAKEAIQNRALDLLQEVYEVSAGNLTIRAKVTDDEIGTIADSYNATIESLHKLVNETKSAAIEVKNNTTTNDVAIQALAQETLVQAQEITETLAQVNAMDKSIRQVAESALRADEFVKQSNLTIDSSDKTINRTVMEIAGVQNTVTETAIKVQKLKESSQEISQTVNLVGRFAAQTHLLALKASIEAARAGERGKGFAVIADEVRSLATQSADATAEIETLVTKIQLETNELGDAMDKGTEQIAAGNQLVQQTRQSLTQISQTSNEISKLVGSITQATKQQSKASAQVSQTMVSVAEIAESSSQSATQVSSSIKELSTVAEKLQSSIGKFKT